MVTVTADKGGVLHILFGQVAVRITGDRQWQVRTHDLPDLVTMTFTYPEVTTIDTFYTTADGDLITPQTCSFSCWAAGWVSADLSEPKKEAAARYLCSSLLLAGMICHFYREGFCSNRSVMLCRLMPRVERLCSMALVAGGRMPSAPRRMSAELKLSTKR